MAPRYTIAIRSSRNLIMMIGIILLYYHNAVMKVKFAYYGLTCAKAIGYLSESNKQRSTRWIAHLCNGRHSCQGRVHNSVLTDPYPGCPKGFIVVAECSNGKIITKEVPPKGGEGQKISLAC